MLSEKQSQPGMSQSQLGLSQPGSQVLEFFFFFRFRDFHTLTDHMIAHTRQMKVDGWAAGATRNGARAASAGTTSADGDHRRALRREHQPVPFDDDAG